MSTILDRTACEAAAQGLGEELLPVSPYTALQYHFGMLLGVDDFEVAEAYPRGKIRLHNAWLHREGVVWGLGVSINDQGELQVDPGLAVDAAGHELHLDVKACLDLGKWYEKHKDDAEFANAFAVDAQGRVTFACHVVARFKACRTRPVPAIGEPCGDTATDTAYSRVFETIDLVLRPGIAPAKDHYYHRLRTLFGLEDSVATVVARRQGITTPAALLEAFRELAALDEIDLQPQQATDAHPDSIFPEDPTEVVLADVANVVVAPVASGGFTVAAAPTVKVTVRPSHVATATIEELLCGPMWAAGGGAGPAPAPAPGVDAGGPRIDRTSVNIADKRITLRTTTSLDDASVDAEAFSITAFDEDDGWSQTEIRKAAFDVGTNTITLDLKEKLDAKALVRIIARGTGPTPLLDVHHVPLAGAPDDPAGSVHDGHDFVHMQQRS